MWPFNRSLQNRLYQTKVVRACGIKFKVKKLNILNHLEGLNVLVDNYATYEKRKEQDKIPASENLKYLDKVKKVYKEIFLATVLEPKLTDDRSTEGQYIDDLFGDWDLCHELYNQIMIYSNKKKTIDTRLVNQK